MGWEMEQRILQEVQAIRRDQNTLMNLTIVMAKHFPAIFKALKDIDEDIDEVSSDIKELTTSQTKCCAEINDKLDKLIEVSIPPTPEPVASFSVTTTVIPPV